VNKVILQAGEKCFNGVTFNLASEIGTAWGLPIPGSQALAWCGVDPADEAFARLSRGALARTVLKMRNRVSKNAFSG
jgi:hypothetical protein